MLLAAFRITRTRIATTVRRLLDAEEFAFVNRLAVVRALERYTKDKADFSDYLLGESAMLAGASTTYTFDRVLSRSAGFSRPR